ncbi:MAG TPA: WbqC family protein [Catalimonadaceae bacterium]|nr:WbqC family protein [Catalimonadaceae bacterium]
MIPDQSAIQLFPLYGIRAIDVFSLREKPNWEILAGHRFQPGAGNRMSVLGANGIINLTIPVKKHPSGMPFFEIQIDHMQKWQNQHWRTLLSAYGKSPFFHYYKEEFEEIINNKPLLLIDFTIPIMKWVHKQLFRTGEFSVNMSPWGKEILENSIYPTLANPENGLLEPEPIYCQVFGDKFVRGLSILDALFCEGPGYLKSKSV